MHFTSFFVAVCAALSAVAAPLPGGETTRRVLPKSTSSYPGNLPPIHLFPPLSPSTSNVFPQSSSLLRHDDSYPRLPITNHIKVVIPRATSGHSPAHVPDVAEIKKHLHVKPNKSLFYSGPGGYKTIADARAKTMGLKILETSWKDFSTVTGSAYVGNVTNGLTRDDQGRFWDNASKAFAELSLGTVHVLLPANVHGPSDFFAQSIWARVEWQALIDNPRVTKVIMINPDNKDERPLFIRRCQRESRNRGSRGKTTEKSVSRKEPGNGPFVASMQ
ncbi:hypothetical protein C0995_012302 [Termitomyces sp. Mi166|nr:hypothetical protein C0995_012302 [Termitomyces sp. Mi166\